MQVMDVFENNYKEGMTIDDSIELALTAINEATDHETSSNNVEIAVITKENPAYSKLTEEEVQKYIDNIVAKNNKKSEEVENE